ncbi:aminopeptidase N-like [Metopolophium dirhodum]|uniref:aminopeptidase N-like n=1 Tax=Metopolophium dirhodum TaxID=44670 RepID=UPI002990774B|nr:aminopeptidase N-like [Metopolophium dirhodum]
MFKLLFLTVCCSCVFAQDATAVREKMDVFRLPNNTEPISYTLDVQTFIDPQNNQFTFAGTVNITIRVKTSTEELILNVDDLKINQIDVTTDSTTKVEVTKNYVVVKNEQLIIQLKSPGLIADRVYNVKIAYSGELRNDMTGFYKSWYKDEDGSVKWLAVTQFEPTYARRAFPCYDEPAFKTPFTISVTRLEKQISLSNMPIAEQTIKQSLIQGEPKYVRDQYQTTEPISTYLVAFSVSEFVNTTKEKRVYIYTHADYINQTTYIEERANKLLNLMEIYTNIPYTYSKIGLLAVPDFSFGAMENWGLNTYREKYLLVTNKSTEKDKEFVITTVQHELSHQWFGDLVTCSSWNYLWLNEAFATLFEYFAVQAAEPDWRIGDLFVIEQHQKALAYDHRPCHPITATVNDPTEIQNIFDTITYNKGASVLRMLNHVLNDDIFRTSLTLYLNTYKYKAAEPKNLWSSFDSVIFDVNYKSGILGNTITVEEFMRSWTDQAGYPVIKIDTSSPNCIGISQKKYQVDVPKSNTTTLWHIGLSYTTQLHKQFNNLQPTVWLTNKETGITIPLLSDEGWVIFNLQSTGFYRVNYDLKNWNRLIAELKYNPKTIHVLNRAQLIDDSFNLARAGELSHFVPFTLVSYLQKEDDYIPWYSVLNSMSFIVERLRRCPHTGAQVKDFAKTYAEIAYKKVSDQYEKNDGKHLTKTSMQAFSNWACKLDVESCVKSTLNYFNAWEKNGTEIPPDVKEAALCNGVKNGTTETWNNVFELFKKTSSTSERQASLLALACSTNSTILSNYLNLLLDGNCPIRPQDYKTVFKSLTSTPVGINVTTEFLQNKINESLSNMWEGEEMIMLMYSYLASSVATVKEINEINAIRRFTYLSPALKESFDDSYKEVELNSAYFERCHPLMHEWFDPPSPTTIAPSSAISNSYQYFNVIVLSLIFVTLVNINYFNVIQ